MNTLVIEITDMERYADYDIIRITHTNESQGKFGIASVGKRNDELNSTNSTADYFRAAIKQLIKERDAAMERIKELESL